MRSRGPGLVFTALTRILATVDTTRRERPEGFNDRRWLPVAGAFTEVREDSVLRGALDAVAPHPAAFARSRCQYPFTGCHV